MSLLTLEMTCGCDDVMQTDICDVTHCPQLLISGVTGHFSDCEHMGEHMVQITYSCAQK